MDLAQTYGIGAIAIALIGLVFKIWIDSTKRTDKVLDVMEKVAISQERLATNIQANTEATKQSAQTAKETAQVAKETAESVKAHADLMSSSIVKLLKNKKL